jgi:hypothetical protein
MKATLRFGFFFVALSAGAFAAAADPQVKVASSRELKVAVVDFSKATPARDTMHQAFAIGLGEALSARCGGQVGVRVKCVGPDHAAFNLDAGVYDAVLVLDNSLPRQLVMSGYSRLVATLPLGKAERKLYFIFNPSDATLAELLTASYPIAINAPRFIQMIGAASSPVVVAGGQ